MTRIYLLFALIIIPLIISGLFGLHVVNRRLEETILAATLEKARNHALELDERLRRFHQSAGVVAEQSCVSKIASPYPFLTDYQRAVQTNLAINLMTNIKLSSDLISNVRLYLGHHNVAYNSQMYAGGSYQAVTNETYESILSRRTSDTPLQLYGGRLVMFWYPATTRPDAIVEIEYDSRRLAQEFLNGLQYTGADWLFRLPTQDYAMSSKPAELSNPSTATGGLSYSDTPVQITFGGRVCYAFSAIMPYAKGEYYQIIPRDVLFFTIKSNSTYSIVFSLVVFAAVCVFLLGVRYMVHRPMHELITAFEHVSMKDFGYRANMPDTSDFAYLFEGFNTMTEQIEAMVEREYKYEAMVKNAELRQLQAQINPHFLYNSFFMLNQMITRGQHEESKHVARLLGAYFKYITRNDDGEVTLADEWHHAKLYCDIQALRFVGRITIEFASLPDSVASLCVPRLIIQPVLENAFQHGMENVEADGLIRVSCEVVDRYVTISIEDNGQSLTDDALANLAASLTGAGSSGLHNIAKRLFIYFGGSVVAVARSPLGGLCVWFNLPLGR